MYCPKHNKELIGKTTKFGMRYDCPVEDCTVMCWGGDTSTPADQETRNARKKAHTAFDFLWKGQKSKRGYYYGQLKEYLGIEPKDNHIGMFDIEMCNKVIQFVKEQKGQDRWHRNTSASYLKQENVNRMAISITIMDSYKEQHLIVTR